MSNIINFGTSLEKVKEKKLERFKELKIKNFNDQLEYWEEKEFDEISDWLNTYNN